MRLHPITLSLILIPAAYLLGSIPFGALIARIWGGVDVRHGGSGNIGASNVARLAGWRPGVLTMLADAAKGALPVGLALAAADGAGGGAIPSLVALAAFAGHLWPFYTLGRGGGKGVATAFGMFLVLQPLVCMAALGVYLAAAWLTRRSSAGSLAASVSLPLIIGWSRAPLSNLLLALVVMACILWRHEANIIRLLQGCEPVFRAKAKP